MIQFNSLCLHRTENVRRRTKSGAPFNLTEQTEQRYDKSKSIHLLLDAIHGKHAKYIFRSCAIVCIVLHVHQRGRIRKLVRRPMAASAVATCGKRVRRSTVVVLVVARSHEIHKVVLGQRFLRCRCSHLILAASFERRPSEKRVFRTNAVRNGDFCVRLPFARQVDRLGKNCVGGQHQCDADEDVGYVVSAGWCDCVHLGARGHQSDAGWDHVSLFVVSTVGRNSDIGDFGFGFEQFPVA